MKLVGPIYQKFLKEKGNIIHQLTRARGIHICCLLADSIREVSLLHQRDHCVLYYNHGNRFRLFDMSVMPKELVTVPLAAPGGGGGGHVCLNLNFRQIFP